MPSSEARTKRPWLSCRTRLWLRKKPDYRTRRRAEPSSTGPARQRSFVPSMGNDHSHPSSEERSRKARVHRQRRQFKGDPYVTYVDVAEYPAGGLFAVAAMNGRDNSLTLAASVRAETPAAAETIAAALVIKQHDRSRGSTSSPFPSTPFGRPPMTSAALPHVPAAVPLPRPPAELLLLFWRSAATPRFPGNAVGVCLLRGVVHRLRQLLTKSTVNFVQPHQFCFHRTPKAARHPRIPISSSDFPFRPRVADAEPNGYVGARVRMDRSCKMTNLSAQRGYDPDAMAWATIPVPEGQQSAVADPIRNEELFRMDPPRVRHKDPARSAASLQRRGSLSLYLDHTQNTLSSSSSLVSRWRYETSFNVARSAPPSSLVGVRKAATLNLLLSPEQNLIIASTREAQTADQLLGDFELQTYKGKMAAHGHLKQHGEDFCYGVVTVANHETTDTLRQALQWRADELLDIRKFGTSNKARLTFAGRVKPRYIHYNSEITIVQTYYRTIPACGLCGTVGDRADSCPNPANAKYSLCGQQTELVEVVRTPHECNPKCAVYGGSHATNSRECTAKYRQPKMTTPQQSGLPKSGKKTRHHAAFSHGGSRYVDVTTQQAPPRGGDVKGQAAQQQPPHDGKGNRGQQQQQRKDRTEIWQRANAVKYGKQEIRKRTEPLSAKIASLEAQLSNPPSAPTSPSASNAESMDSEITLPKPSGHDSFETMEARLSAKMELLIGTAMAQMLAKIDELITSKDNQAVAAQLRTLRKAGPLRDVFGNPSKFSRRIVDIDDDEDCTLAGLDAKTLLHSLLTPNLTMAGTPKVRRSAPSKSASPIIITQWIYRGLHSRTKRVDLRLFLSTFEHLPAVVALQEPGKGATLTNYSTFHQDPSSCLCVHRNYTANKVDLDLQTDYSYVMVTLLPLRKQDPSIHILSVYCSPKLQNFSFADLFSRALRVAGRDPLLIVGHFNAPSRVWGYRREEKRGRKLAELTDSLTRSAHLVPRSAGSWIWTPDSLERERPLERERVLEALRPLEDERSMERPLEEAWSWQPPSLRRGLRTDS
ncbi:hypothetical protein HPB49_022449 [Dermacentor silvarum]|uniref:Uncharacterized protein n=1 Tax=Dermacentor silvarum TaxID=543639 RepID=A0ACB8DGG4_DERSI|nr:hypothetical protein HPB49_022449 [Dermacentor silvarum]